MPRKAREVDLEGRVRCPKCQEWKHLSEYYRNPRTHLGISAYCKACHKEYQKKYIPQRLENQKKYTLKEAAAILALQNYRPETVGPPDGSEPEEVPDRPEEAELDVQWVAGIGWCKVEPIPPEMFLPRRTEPTPKKEIEAESFGTAHEAYQQVKRFRQERLASKKDEDILRDAGGIGEAWNSPKKDWSIWHLAVYEELLARGLAKPIEDD